jgi:hypothetical protein
MGNSLTKDHVVEVDIGMDEGRAVAGKPGEAILESVVYSSQEIADPLGSGGSMLGEERIDEAPVAIGTTPMWTFGPGRALAPSGQPCQLLEGFGAPEVGVENGEVVDESLEMLGAGTIDSVTVIAGDVGEDERRAVSRDLNFRAEDACRVDGKRDRLKETDLAEGPLPLVGAGEFHDESLWPFGEFGMDREHLSRLAGAVVDAAHFDRAHCGVREHGREPLDGDLTRVGRDGHQERAPHGSHARRRPAMSGRPKAILPVPGR